VGHGSGEVELEGKVLVVKRIRVTYTGVAVTDENRETVERVLRVHAAGCPIARSIEGAIEITTVLG
jgi:organic hydroperoxide reductase OsmC/OhrA